MAKLSDTIEEFILSMLNACDNSVDIRRNELAEYFGCVPSQINYVISTRFTMDKGFSVESKKGGGGYVRIKKHNIESDSFLTYLLQERLGGSITYRECEDIVGRLCDQGYLTEDESRLILAAVKDTPIPISLELKDMMRAYVMKSIIMTILKIREGN